MKSIDNLIEEYIESGFFSAAICSISVNGENLYKKSFGIRDSASKEPCNVDTMFDLASITKLFTTTIILRLITEKRFSLNSSLGACLPAVKDNPQLKNITIYQLLTHSSGLLAWYPFYTKGEENFFEVLDNIEVKTSSGEKTVYSDLNFMLLGKVIEQTLNMTLDDAVDYYFTDQLNFSAVTYTPSNSENIAATEYGNRIEKKMCNTRNLHFNGWRDENKPMIGEVNDGNSHYYFKGVAGHAGIFSNVDDLVALGTLYLGKESKNFIDKDLINASLSRQIDDRGLGWECGETFPEGFGHTGFTGTALWVVPGKNLVVGLLTNRLHTREPQYINPFRKKLFNEILNQI